MNLVVRPMRAEELETCAALFDRVVRATFTWLDPGDPAQDFRYATLEEEVLVAEVESRIIGLAAFYRPDDFLHSIYIDAEWQGRGVGRALMREVEARADLQITLKVQVLNLAARRFYARDGFRVLEEGGDALPSNNRWLMLGRKAPARAPSPEPVLEIRLAIADELDLCAALYARQAARLFTWEPPEARTAESKRVSFEEKTVLVAQEHGVLAGFAAFVPENSFVDSLFVEPQGAGTGPALLRAAQGACAGPIELDCDARNGPALRFYARNGFHERARTPYEHFTMVRLRRPAD